MDLSQLSDADLDALSRNDMKSVSDEGLAHLHAQAPQPAPEEPSMLKQAGRAAIDAIPMVGGVAGGALGAATGFLGGLGVGAAPGMVAGSGLGYAGGVGVKNLINRFVDPENAPHTSEEALSSVAKGVPEGMAQEVGGQVLGAGLQKVGNAVSPAFKSLARSQVRAATGATGLQARNFAPGTEDALLDNLKLFGRSQENIAWQASDLLDKTGQNIGNIVSDLSPKGVAKTNALLAEKKSLEALIAHDPGGALTHSNMGSPQLNLPGQVDDLQRTISLPTQVELGGAGGPPVPMPSGQEEAARLYARPGEANFGSIGGDTADRLGSNVVQGLEQSAKSNFLSQNPGFKNSDAGVVPRSFANAEIPGIVGESGQTEMDVGFPKSNSTTYLDGLKNRLAEVNQQLSSGPGSRETLLSVIDSKLGSLADDPGAAQIRNQLQSIRDEVASGPAHPSFAQIEKTKGTFQKLVNWTNPEGNAAKAAAADIYKEAGEGVANSIDEDAAAEFMRQKKLYGQMQPVAEAAGKRAATTSQSPTGGLGDMSAYIAAGPQGVIAKKVLFPRVNSSMASTANSLSQVLKTAPQTFGKWAAPLSQAAARGEMSLNAADYILQQTDPDYRQRRQNMNEIHTDDGQSVPQAKDDQLESTSSNFRTK